MLTWLIFTGTVTLEHSKLHDKECLNVLFLTYIPTAKYNMSSYVQVYLMVFLVCIYYMHPQVTKNNIEALVSQYKKATAGFTSRTAPEKVCMYFNVICSVSSYHICTYVWL